MKDWALTCATKMKVGMNNSLLTCKTEAIQSSLALFHTSTSILSQSYGGNTKLCGSVLHVNKYSFTILFTTLGALRSALHVSTELFKLLFTMLQIPLFYTYQRWNIHTLFHRAASVLHLNGESFTLLFTALLLPPFNT